MEIGVGVVVAHIVAAAAACIVEGVAADVEQVDLRIVAAVNEQSRGCEGVGAVAARAGKHHDALRGAPALSYLVGYAGGGTLNEGMDCNRFGRKRLAFDGADIFVGK